MNALPSSVESRAANFAAPDATRIVLTTGTPLGEWGAVAAALLGSAPAGTELRAAALAAWCDQALGDVDARLAGGAVSWLQADGLASSLRDLVPSSGTLWGGVDSRLCWAVAALDAVWPGAHWIVFVEAPSRAVARRLGGPGDLDVSAVIRAWCAGASELLGLHRGAPGRCVLIEASEASQAPVAAAAALQESLGVSFGAPVSPAASSPDPLALALAEGLIPAEHEARALYAELLAACRPLQGMVAPPASIDGAAAGLRALQEAAGRSSTLAAEVAALRSELEERHVVTDQMQEELEYFHAEIQELKRRPLVSSVVALARPGPSMGGLFLGPERDTPPHRELSIQVDGLRVSEAAAPQSMDLRLVEHHGRAGLVVFGDAGSSALAGWVESGHEDGRGYMLLIPSDRNTWPALRALTAMDQRVLEAILDRLVKEIPGSMLELKACWSLVAARFRQQWTEASTTLRCDVPSVTPLPADGAGGGVELALGMAALGDRMVDGLRVRLRSGPLVELAGVDSTGMPLLPSWPLRPDGRPLPAWELPLGASAAAARGRSRWEGCTSADRAFVRALLEALPRLVNQPQVAPVLQAAGLASVGLQLGALASEAHTSMRPGLKRRLADQARAWRDRKQP